MPSPSLGGSPLFGAAAASARSAWAVCCGGWEGGPNRAPTLRLNTTSWRQVPSPAPAGTYLYGAAAASARSAWAVGYSVPGKAVTLRWNGAVWKQVPSWPPRTPSLRSRYVFDLTSTQNLCSALCASRRWCQAMLLLQ